MGRPRIKITEETEKKARRLLLSLVPRDGKRVANSALRRTFLDESRKELKQAFGEEVYWQIRNGLIETGRLERGRGKGGTIRLVADTLRQRKPRAKRRGKESGLYGPFHETVQTEWVQEYDITEYVTEISAHKGKTHTGGKWTRPDVTLVSVGTYTFIPEKTIEVITFEIKPEDATGVEGIYEAASHSAFANKSYLALHLPENQQDTDFLERLEEEAIRFGVGLVTFGDPAKWDTFEVRVEAQHKTPSPSAMNKFLSLMKKESTEKLLKLVK
ncbi:MAG: hypothetical protein WAO35_14765 [Terriglobia bacterium]